MPGHSVLQLPVAALEEWVRARTAHYDPGFVSTDFLWSPVDYRAGFEKQGSAWRIVFFLAGD